MLDYFDRHLNCRHLHMSAVSRYDKRLRSENLALAHARICIQSERNQSTLRTQRS